MITVAGLAPSLDLTYVVDDLQLGRIHRPDAFVSCPGGKPLNCARAAHRLGVDVEVVALLGGPTGEVLRAGLETEGVGVNVVSTPMESRTCVSIASESGGTLTEVYPYADPLSPEVWSDFRTALATTVRDRPGWLVVSGGAPRDLADDALADLVQLGHDAGLRVAVDTHGAALPPAVDARPALIKINRTEAAELTGHDPDAGLVTMVEAIRARTAGIVIVTDGDRGATGGDGSAVTVTLPQVAGRYPVGSGDSFLGGLLADLDAGRPLAEALVTAAAAGTANALVPGPGRFDRQTVRELRSRISTTVV